MNIFDIHSINTEPFNMGTDANPCILHISKDITLEKRRELEKLLTKYSKVFAWTYDTSTGTSLNITSQLKRDTSQ